MSAAPIPSLYVDVSGQKLHLKHGHDIARSYPVSTSSFGLGSEPGSYKTPLGLHRIARKIGAGLPLAAILKTREWTGKIWSSTDPVEPGSADLVLTRILWLEGMEDHNLTTMDRYIYIHGTNHEQLLGTPASHGCVRMGNADIAELFEVVPVGTEVYISEGNHA